MSSRERLESHASHAIQFFIKVAVIKTECNHCFFFFPSVLFLRYCDFGAYQAPKNSLLTRFSQIIARSVSKNWLDIQFNHQWKTAFHWDKYRALKCLYEYMNELFSTHLYGLYKGVSPGKDITRWCEDMNFIFERQNNILRSSAASE